MTAAASRTVAADAAKGGANADGGGGNGGGENLSRVSTWVWRTIYLTAAAAGTGLAAQYAYDPTPIRQVGQSLYDGMNSRMRFLTEPSREKLLPDVRPGAYGAMGTPRTLVIELENTLVYSSYSRATGWRVAKRPGAEAFLAYLASFYELVVFTGNMNSYADPILNKLDPNGYVQYRLYRPETTMQNGVHVKDISGLNRPLDRVVVIDKDEECVANQRENAIVVPEWKGDPSDTTLLDLIPLLEGIVREDVRDVRDVLRDIAGKPVSEAVTAYRAGAAARAEQAAYARPASLFGHAPAEVVAAQQDSADSGAAVQAQENPTSQEDSKDEGDGDAQQQENSSSLWGALPGRTKLFNTKGISQTDATK